MIKWFVMDVDGTLTDGKIYISEQGEAFKAFNIKDGYGIHDILLARGIIPVIITGRESEIVISRCRELGIKNIYQKVSDKNKKMHEFINDFSKVAYVGDDDNDIGCMLEVKKAGGIVGCPHNASEKVVEISDYISPYDGGEGAVRDFINFLVEKSKI